MRTKRMNRAFTGYKVVDVNERSITRSTNNPSPIN